MDSTRLFSYFQRPLIFLAKTTLKCLVSCLSTFQRCHFRLQSFPGHAGSLGNNHADSLPKAGASPPTAMVPCPSPQLSPKLVTPGITNGDFTFPHSPSHFNGPVPTVSPLELVLSRPTCFELSAFVPKVKASYNCRSHS